MTDNIICIEANGKQHWFKIPISVVLPKEFSQYEHVVISANTSFIEARTLFEKYFGCNLLYYSNQLSDEQIKLKYSRNFIFDKYHILGGIVEIDVDNPIYFYKFSSDT